MPEELQSKITDEHRAAIGRKSDPIRFTIRAEDVQRMRGLLDESDPRWSAGAELAPPYALAMFQTVQRDQPLPRVLPNGIMTQQEWRFTRPFRVGEELQAVSQVIDIRDRLGGRYGYSVLLTHSTDFFDRDGGHVAAILLTVTQFDPASLRDNR